MLNRRSFFAATACLGAAVGLGAEKPDASSTGSPRRKRIKLGTRTKHNSRDSIPNKPKNAGYHRHANDH